MNAFKNMTLQKFFQLHFPPAITPQYILFANMKTGGYDIVARSGVIMVTIPAIDSLSPEDNKALANEVLLSLHEDCFGLNEFYPVSYKLCQFEKCWKRFSPDKYFDYPAGRDPEYAYHPDMFK